MASSKRSTESIKLALLGRTSGYMSMGLVGLPNSGKSTTFSTLTHYETLISSRPFSTIDPAKARVNVPDERWQWLCDIYKPKKCTPASIEVVDIAGLVKDAHTGQGMGNDFLSHIQSVDGIYHVVRLFDDDSVAHFEGDVDPVRDLEIIAEELRMKDLSKMEKMLEAHERKYKAVSTKAIAEERAILKKIVEWVREHDINTNSDWTDDDITYINRCGLLTAKPIVYLLNMSEHDYRRQKNRYLAKVMQWIKDRTPDAMIVPFCAPLEHQISQAGDEEARKAAAEAAGVKSQIDRIIHAGYQALSLIHYFTAGEDDVHCWTIRKGSTAPIAAGVIHTDFERTFIAGTVIPFEDLHKAGGMNEARAEGLVKQVGKTYVVEDGDLCLWHAGAARSRK